MGTVVATAVAFDADLYAYGTVVYSLEGTTQLVINPTTGVITTAVLFDYTVQTVRLSAYQSV